MTHDEARELLDAWLDNELDPAAATGIERHLKDCARCASLLTERRQLRSLMQLPGVRHATPPTATLALGRVTGRPPRVSLLRAILSANPIDVVSSDHHTVKPWFAQRLPFSPPVPQFAAGADALVGGRVDLIARQRVAVLVYRHGNHSVDVFVMPGGGAGPLARRSATVDGFNMLTGRWQGFEIAWVSDASAPELDGFRGRWLTQATEQASLAPPR